MDWSLLDWTKVIDLTHPLSPQIPTLPGDPSLVVEPGSSGPPEGEGGEAWRTLRVTLSDHAGTHLDAPCHFFAGGLSTERIPASDLVLPGVMLDVREQCLEDQDYRIGVNVLERWEKEHGFIPPRSAVLFQTGWAFRWGDARRYLSLDEHAVPRTPGLGAEAAELLVRERQVRMVGIDAPSVDVGRSTTFPVHRTLLGAGCYLLENLNNLYLLPENGFVLVAAPLRLVGGTGSPCRVLALVDRRG